MGLLRKLFSKKTSNWTDLFHNNLSELMDDQKINLILDVGANQGQYAEGLFSLGYKGHIISFEPGAAAHAALSAKASNNAHWIAAPRMALGRKRETLTLHTFDRTDMNSLLPPNSDALKCFPKMVPTQTEEVPVERLDEMLKNILPAELQGKELRIFLKVDTQGSELAVVEGASGCLDQLTLLQVEVPVMSVYEGAPNWMEVSQPLHQRGFRLALVSPGFFSKKVMGMLDMDLVFLAPKIRRGS
jgi:FkbM family methyltransferase